MQTPTDAPDQGRQEDLPEAGPIPENLDAIASLLDVARRGDQNILLARLFHQVLLGTDERHGASVPRMAMLRKKLEAVPSINVPVQIASWILDLGSNPDFERTASPKVNAELPKRGLSYLTRQGDGLLRRSTRDKDRDLEQEAGRSSARAAFESVYGVKG